MQTVPSAIEKALEFKHVAVVGLSRDPSKAAHTVPRYLQHHDYKIYPVNPFAKEQLLGEKVHEKTSEIEEVVDLVLVFRPSADVLPVVKDALKRDDIKGIWLQEGITSLEAQELAEKRGLVFVEDKCIFKEHRRAKR